MFPWHYRVAAGPHLICGCAKGTGSEDSRSSAEVWLDGRGVAPGGTGEGSDGGVAPDGGGVAPATAEAAVPAASAEVPTGQIFSSRIGA